MFAVVLISGRFQEVESDSCWVNSAALLAQLYRHANGQLCAVVEPHNLLVISDEINKKKNR